MWHANKVTGGTTGRTKWKVFRKWSYTLDKIICISEHVSDSGSARCIPLHWVGNDIDTILTYRTRIRYCLLICFPFPRVSLECRRMNCWNASFAQCQWPGESRYSVFTPSSRQKVRNIMSHRCAGLNEWPRVVWWVSLHMCNFLGTRMSVCATSFFCLHRGKLICLVSY